MKPFMYIKWGELGAESSPQSEPGDTSSSWLPCKLADNEAIAKYNPSKQSVRYELKNGIVYQVIDGDAADTYADLRKQHYPSIEDQLDALWKGGAFQEEMRKEIFAVKAKFPKPKKDSDESTGGV
jgi:hypothetical protein